MADSTTPQPATPTAPVAAAPVAAPVAPAAPQQAAPVERATPTTVIITQADGSKFTVDTHNISAEDADALYQSLGKVNGSLNYQELTNKLAPVIRDFKSVISVDLQGKTVQQAVDGLMTSLREGNGKLKDGDKSPQWMKDLLHSPLGGSIVSSGIYKSVEGTAAVAGFGLSVGKGYFVKPWEIGGKAGDLAFGTVGDVAKQAGAVFAMSDRQAQRMAAVYAAHYYMQVDSPDGEYHEANFIDKSVARVQSATDGALRHLPPEFTAVFVAIGKFIKYALEGKGFHPKAAFEEALAEVKEERSKPALSYEETLKRNLAESADKSSRPQAVEMLAASEAVAGEKTQEVADIIRQGGVYRGRDGVYKTLDFKEGQPVTDTLKGPEGQPITITSRAADRGKALVESAPDNTGEWIGLGLATATAASIERTRLAPIRGVWNMGMHATAGAVKIGTDVTTGALAGINRGIMGFASWVMPNSESRSGLKALNANADMVEAAANAEASKAMKAAKKAGLTGDELTKVVNEARDIAAKEAAETLAANGSLKTRGVLSRMADPFRGIGDGIEGVNTKVNGFFEAISHNVRGGADAVKSALLFDRRTGAQKAADALKATPSNAVVTAMGNVSQDTLDAAQAAKAETLAGKASTAYTKVSTGISSILPKWLGGKEAEVAVEVAEKIAPKMSKLFSLSRAFGKFLPWVAAFGAVTTTAHAADTYEKGDKTLAAAQMADIMTMGIAEGGVKGTRLAQKADAIPQAQVDAFLAAIPELKVGFNRQTNDLATKIETGNPALDSFLWKREIVQHRSGTGGKPQSPEKQAEVVEQAARDYLASEGASLKNALAALAKLPAALFETKPQPMTAQEVAAAHEGVIQQARMSTAAGRTGANKPGPINFNLGTSVTTVGAVHRNGLPNPTGGNTQTGNAQQQLAVS